MILNFNLILFINILLLGTILSLSSNNWISMWLGIEISLMSFIPFMSSNNKLSSESCLKYFIVQSLSSSMMMMGVIMISLNFNFKMIIVGAMIMKIGLVPFHNWIITIVDSLNMISLFLLFTILKLPPLNIISYMNLNMQLLILLSLMVSSISALNKNSLKKILCYSSIYNLSMILSSINEYSIWISFMILYSISNIFTMILIFKLNINFINQVIINNMDYTSKLTMWIMMMGMGGLPPFFMFLAKMMILENLIMKNNYLMIIVILMTSLISMFFYIRMSIKTMMTYFLMMKWMSLKNNSFIKLINLMILTFPILLTLKSLM